MSRKKYAMKCDTASQNICNVKCTVMQREMFGQLDLTIGRTSQAVEIETTHIYMEDILS